MKFGALPITKALGHTLAHSLDVNGLRLKKGRVLQADDIVRLNDNGITTITVAQFAPEDLDEDMAATRLATSLISDNIRITEAFSGRVNLIAECPGVIRVNAADIAAFNSVDEAITMATLPDYARVHAGSLLATIKIIPYAVGKDQVAAVLARLGQSPLSLHPLRRKSAQLILTETPGFKPSLLHKGEQAVQTRADALGMDLMSVEIVAHRQDDIATAIAKTTADMVLILGASATSDRQDVAPAALVQSGGRLVRFGMPVDPGNLLFLGEIGGRSVVGLPGCARSPALNGTDWVLERLMADLPVTSEDIAAMGVGGLLKEVPTRPQPRRVGKQSKGNIHILLLAAGKSSRMGRENKLLRHIDGQPLVARTATRLQQAKADGMSIVINPETKGIQQALQGIEGQIIIAKDANTGLAASLRAGLHALSPETSAVIVALADMPDITTQDINALIKAYDPKNGALIIAPLAPNGKRGNPVLFDRRYFETLASLNGDTGAKALIDAETDALRLIPAHQGVLVDLDTPEAWAAWEQSRR